jgi:hypothetical protein
VLIKEFGMILVDIFNEEQQAKIAEELKHEAPPPCQIGSKILGESLPLPQVRPQRESPAPLIGWTNAFEVRPAIRSHHRISMGWTKRSSWLPTMPVKERQNHSTIRRDREQK